MTHQTQAEQLRASPEVLTAIDTILRTVESHKSKILEPRPAQTSVQATIGAFEDLRGNKLAYPYLASGLGNGALVELTDGSVKYDMITGIGVHLFGHNDLELTRATLESALSSTIMQGNLHQDEQTAAFTRLLLDVANRSGGRFKHGFVTSTGVMAGENAFKMALQKRYPASRVICLSGCFMGRTLAMSFATDNPAYRQGLPKTIDVDYIPGFDAAHPDESINRSAARLKEILRRHPGQHALLSLELILGEGGFYPGSAKFFTTLITIAKEHGLFVLVDEVQTFARTSQMFAFQHFGLDELVDAVWIGKASQACATLFVDELTPKPGLISQTYTASTTAIAAGLNIIKRLRDGKYYGAEGRMMQINHLFSEQFQDMAKRHPGKVSGPYGVGAMVSFQYEAGTLDGTKTFLKRLFENGVIGFYCGHDPVRVRFLPPAGCLTDHDIQAVCRVIEATL